MLKDTSALMYDPDTKIPYVRKVRDELTKNHCDCDSELQTAFMPQMLDPNTGRPHKMCPVRSFENFITHLNPDCNKLWQHPLSRKLAQDEQIWYKAEPIGQSPLEKLMSRMSTKCKLSQKYTNHCIRVTGATNLARAKFNCKQIMSVTGHKSIHSLAVYQSVGSNKKMMMGMSLT